MTERVFPKAKLDPALAKPRNCLTCREEFMSEWKGNRVCPRCKTTSEWHRSGGLPPGGLSAGGRVPRRGGGG